MELNPRVRGVQNVTLAGCETTLQFSMENFTGQLQKNAPNLIFEQLLVYQI